jgi:hypothetical protein
MELPLPNPNENRGDYIKRVMQHEDAITLHPITEQRLHACYAKWAEAKANSMCAVGSGDNEVLVAAQRFGGKKRSDLKDSDFLYPQERSFPIVTPKDIKDAVSSFGRSKGKNYEDFKKKLVRKAKSKGPEFVAALPSTIKEEFNIKASDDAEDIREQYISQEKEVIAEIVTAVTELAAFLEDEAYHEKLTEAWVFEKLVIGKAMLCGAKAYVKYGQVPKDDDDDVNPMTGIMTGENPQDDVVPGASSGSGF